jgi:hypothetical protein
MILNMMDNEGLFFKNAKSANNVIATSNQQIPLSNVAIENIVISFFILIKVPQNISQNNYNSTPHQYPPDEWYSSGLALLNTFF